MLRNMHSRFFLIATIALLIPFTSCIKKKPATDQAAAIVPDNRLYFEMNDFESVADWRVDSTKGLSGKICGVVNDKIEYGYGFDKQIGQIASYKSIEEINVGFNCKMDKKTDADVFVFSVEDTVAKKSVYWESKGVTPAKTGEWSPINLNFKVKKEYLNPSYILKLYPWNKGKNTYYIDDLWFSFDKSKK